MTRLIRIFLMSLALVFLSAIGSGPLTVYAAVPHLINYQGRVTDTSGNPLNGSYDLTFRIYDAETAGNLLWEETQAGVVVDKGLFGILLGSVTALDIPFDKPYFLEIKVGTEVMSPRQRITSAGYAIRAETAEALSGPGKVGMKTVDETGLANGMRPYYDSVSGKIKWNTITIPQAYSFAWVTGSDFTTSSRTLVNITGLSVALEANSIYEFEVLLNGCPSSPDNTFSMQFSASGASHVASYFGNGSAYNVFVSNRHFVFDSGSRAFWRSGDTENVLLIKGIVTTGANAGNLTVQGRTASGTLTIYLNSFLKVIKIA